MAGRVRTPEADNNSPDANFGQILCSLRLRERLSQKTTAEILNMNPASLSRLERGTRSGLPRKADWEELRNLPGVTEADIRLLLAAPGAPRTIFEQPRKDPSEQLTLLSSATAIHLGNATLYLRLDVVPNPDQEQADVDDLMQLLAAQDRLTLRNHFRSRTRTKR